MQIKIPRVNLYVDLCWLQTYTRVHLKLEYCDSSSELQSQKSLLSTFQVVLLPLSFSTQHRCWHQAEWENIIIIAVGRGNIASARMFEPHKDNYLLLNHKKIQDCGKVIFCGI